MENIVKDKRLLETYEELLRRSLILRQQGREIEEDILTEVLDFIWRQLNEHERNIINSQSKMEEA